MPPYDVSATGFSLVIRGSETFPQGFELTAFADDQDPLSLPDTTSAEAAMDINGNLISWSTPQPQEVTINVLPDTREDYNLGVLLEANMAKRGRRPAGDVITLVAMYGNGAVTTARNGKILSGPRGTAVSSSGRLGSKSYTFTFQDFDVVRAQPNT